MAQVARKNKCGRRRKYDWARFRSLYNVGCSDCEIARQTGATTWAVLHFRRVNDLPALSKGGMPKGNKWYDWTRAFDLHADGSTDREIALELGRDQQTVQKWRRTRGLKANYAKPGFYAHEVAP